MDSFEPDGNGATNGNGAQEALPPPPPVIPPHVVPVRAETDQPPEPVKKKVVRVPIARHGLGTKGQKIPLLTNHFKVNVSNVDGHFFHYSVCSVYLLHNSCWVWMKMLSFPTYTYISTALYLLNRFLWLMKMGALLTVKVLEERWLIGFRIPMILS